LSSCHPTIWKFIEAIQKEQSLNEMKINQYIAGTVEPSRKRKKNTLKELVNDYDNWDRLDLLYLLLFIYSILQIFLIYILIYYNFRKNLKY